MSKGRTWPPEWRTFTDPVSGACIRQLTDYKGHSYHLYFTNPGWYDGGRRLLFGSDRDNRTNLFSLDLVTGEMTQLTDLAPVKRPRELCFLQTCVNPTRDEAYFWYGDALMALDLHTLAERRLWRMPAGFMNSQVNCTADGRWVCGGVFEDLSDRFPVSYHQGYVGFRETWEARPRSLIVAVASDGSQTRTVWEERYWIGHINTSPTQPHLLTFCHEGPWHLVDNRIWGLDLQTGRVWRIRPREADESIGHEYWLADGIHIGYHGQWPDGRKCFGRIRYDNTDRLEVDGPAVTGHMHSNDFTLLVGDGYASDGLMRLWRYNGHRLEGPRVLCRHRSSSHVQITHVHPRFTPDGRQVLYTSDTTGYGNLYLVDVPAFDSLPTLEQVAR